MHKLCLFDYLLMLQEMLPARIVYGKLLSLHHSGFHRHHHGLRDRQMYQSSVTLDMSMKTILTVGVLFQVATTPHRCP